MNETNTEQKDSNSGSFSREMHFITKKDLPLSCPSTRVPDPGCRKQGNLPILQHCVYSAARRLSTQQQDRGEYC